MDKDFSLWLANLSTYSVSIPLIIGLIFFLRLNFEQKILIYFLIVSILFEIMANKLATVAGSNNLYLLHIFTVLEFSFIAVIYRFVLKSWMSSKWIYGLIAFFVVFAYLNTLFFEKLTEFNSIARAIEGLLIITLCLIYFYKVLTEMKIKRLESEPMFWLNTGLIIYFSASLFIFIFSNYIEPSTKLSLTFWGIHAILTIIKNLFFTITLWIKPPKPVLPI